MRALVAAAFDSSGAWSCRPASTVLASFLLTTAPSKSGSRSSGRDDDLLSSEPELAAWMRPWS